MMWYVRETLIGTVIGLAAGSVLALSGLAVFWFVYSR